LHGRYPHLEAQRQAQIILTSGREIVLHCPLPPTKTTVGIGMLLVPKIWLLQLPFEWQAIIILGSWRSQTKCLLCSLLLDKYCSPLITIKVPHTLEAFYSNSHISLSLQWQFESINCQTVKPLGGFICIYKEICDISICLMLK